MKVISELENGPSGFLLAYILGLVASGHGVVAWAAVFAASLLIGWKASR